MNALTRPGEEEKLKIAVRDSPKYIGRLFFMRKIQYCNYEHSNRDYKMKHGAQYKQKTQPGIKHGLRFLFI